MDAAEDGADRVRCTIRFAPPPLVVALLAEARDLHDAVSGGQAGVGSFVESLVAEAWAGPGVPIEAPGAQPARLDRGAREGSRAGERDWSLLRENAASRGVLDEVRSTLLSVERLCGIAVSNSEDSDCLICALTELEDEIDRRLGELLADMSERRSWQD